MPTQADESRDLDLLTRQGRSRRSSTSPQAYRASCTGWTGPRRRVGSRGHVLARRGFQRRFAWHNREKIY